jgi:hypothetical protein
MILELEDDFSDQIVVNVLADSYVSMTSMLKNGIVHHEDDVKAYKEMLPAIKLIGGWFSTNFDAEIKKAKKRT